MILGLGSNGVTRASKGFCGPMMGRLNQQSIDLWDIFWSSKTQFIIIMIIVLNNKQVVYNY